MKCPNCGAESFLNGSLNENSQFMTWYSRVCENGHRFKTVEVHPPQLADAREMSCAIRSIHKRIERYKRNIAIAADTRPSRVVAEEHGITDTRVRQIRASLPSAAEGAFFGKIVSGI